MPAPTKEKTARKWIVDHDLIENVLYLPENLFYNSTAPGIVLFLKNGQAQGPTGYKTMLVNGSQVFETRDLKNFIPSEGVRRIADTLIGWKAEEKLSPIVGHAELKKNDYNIAPTTISIPATRRRFSNQQHEQIRIRSFHRRQQRFRLEGAPLPQGVVRPFQGY